MPDFTGSFFNIILIFAFLSLAPFALMMVTSFVKLTVVFSLIRNALGIQQIPPGIVVNALCILLSVFIMAPTINETYQLVSQSNFTNETGGTDYEKLYYTAKGPITDFLHKQSKVRERQFFMRTADVMWPEEFDYLIKEDSLLILIPAFIVSELTSAFEIGFLIYLPFIVIDMIVSNILLAMGMMMVSPMTISLPFKLLLFVLASGWSKIIYGVVLTYR